MRSDLNIDAADILELQPIDRIEGLVQLPGSKSLSNRILLLAALSKDITCIENVLVSFHSSSPTQQY